VLKGDWPVPRKGGRKNHGKEQLFKCLFLKTRRKIERKTVDAACFFFAGKEEEKTRRVFPIPRGRKKKKKKMKSNETAYYHRRKKEKDNKNEILK